jgi:hypothetical protein
MKKAIWTLVILSTVYGCSKNDDPATTPELPADTYIVTRVTAGTDSLVLSYNEDGLVTKFSDWTGGIADSFEVKYNEKGLSEFKYFALTGIRTDRQFVYEGDHLAIINYYNPDLDGQLVITDKDSLVYKDGKLAEYHEISGGMRNAVYKLTWLGDNVEKAEFFLVAGTTEIPMSVTTYDYSDKIGYQHVFRKDFLSRYEPDDFSLLSAKAVIKEEQKEAGTGDLYYTAEYTTAYDENGNPTEVKMVKDDKQAAEVTTVTLKLEYAVLQ